MLAPDALERLDPATSSTSSCEPRQPPAGLHYPRSTGELRSWFETDADCLDYLDWLADDGRLGGVAVRSARRPRLPLRAAVRGRLPVDQS